MSNKTKQMAVKFLDEEKAVTIRITGAAFENLKAIAGIFSKWDKEKTTPAMIVSRFLCADDEWINLENRQTSCHEISLAEGICEAFDNCEDIEELKAAFEAAGFSTGI